MIADDLYIVLISVHGLIRGHDLELGRDSDTGGQTKYVVELAQALAEDPRVKRVDLITRQVFDHKVNQDYSKPLEEIAPGAFIVRIPFGPKRYLRKESLWPYLDQLADSCFQHFRKVGQTPDIIHGHYADAGYVGTRVASLLRVPLFFTGHSLGRVKRQRLLEQGVKFDIIEKQYIISNRIEGEELTLDNAAKVITSTYQEVEDQYSIYDCYEPRRMSVIPPGVIINRFYPPNKFWHNPTIQNAIDRFLKVPNKPIILAMSRPDPRKNIISLVHAYGQSEDLKNLANLVIIAGNRDDISTLDRGSKEVLTELLLLIDKYNLYGHVAYPKYHLPDDVPEIYRIAVKRKGVFVNPALTEPFGLTLIEAAASGLPIVATEDGGPRDIISHCKNGILIDPLNIEAMTYALIRSLEDKEQWLKWSKSGLKGVKKHYTWSSHVKKYLQIVERLTTRSRRGVMIRDVKSRLPIIKKLIVCDIDNTLLGNKESLKLLLKRIEKANENIGFGIATGRRLDSALKILKEWGVPHPDVLITSVGSEIHYGEKLVPDTGWDKHISYRWNKDSIADIMDQLPGIKPQATIDQRKHKISYFIDPGQCIPIRSIVGMLRKNNLHVNVIYSHQQFLDILPIRASKGLAVRYFAMKWGMPLDQILVAGDSGNDEEMLRGNTLAVVVGNYSSELEILRGDPHIYFAEGHFAKGILEGIDHYQFLDD